MMYVRFPLSLRQVEDLLHERGIDICYETVRAWWNRFGPTFAAEIKKQRSVQMRAGPQWLWHLDEVFVRINGETHYLWRAVDHEGEVLEAFITTEKCHQDFRIFSVFPGNGHMSCGEVIKLLASPRCRKWELLGCGRRNPKTVHKGLRK